MDRMTNTTTGTTPTTDPTDDLQRVLDLHLAAYCEPDTTGRAGLVAEAWSDTGALVDPPFEGTGHEAIAAMADGVLAHYPGHTFRRTTAIDAHHTFARYGWQLVAPDGSVAVAGTDVVELAGDGRIARIVGFFGDLT